MAFELTFAFQKTSKNEIVRFRTPVKKGASVLLQSSDKMLGNLALVEESKNLTELVTV